MKNETSIDSLQLAKEFSCFTNRSLFITGKAGTGKTTFLTLLREQCLKRLLIVAPTGIAAVNATGLTIHSFFQFPFEILDECFFNESMPVYSIEKRRLIQELELLVIDEVSMVRADVMDGIDRVLRHYRKKTSIPFGGVQLLLIGDLFQLSPVLDDQTTAALNKIYPSPFFFEAHSIKTLNYLLIELSTVFRQADNRFIDLLNAVRQNNCSDHDLQLLNERCVTGVLPSNEHIFLTTHRATAANLNKISLDKLNSPLVVLDAQIEGEFPENSDPAPRRLELKIGARIIFTRNDNSESKEYYNGKAGILKEITNDKLVIDIEESKTIELERSIWINRGARYNDSTSKIELTELGSLRQFPVRLAWAITIHKSQGMTFEKAVIDASNAFASGQVYVALSRVRTIEGLFLKEPLTRAAIQTDPRIVAFYQLESNRKMKSNDLAAEKAKYSHELLCRLFQFDICIGAIQSFVKSHSDLNISSALSNAANALLNIVDRFDNQLQGLLAAAYHNQYLAVHNRVEQAVNYFSERVSIQLIQPLHKFAATISDTKKNEPLIGELNKLLNLFEARKRELQTALHVADVLAEGADTKKVMEIIYQMHEGAPLFALELKKRESKNNNQTTQQKTLSLFQKGFSLDEIAQKRNLVRGTIEEHLNSFIKTGEVGLHQLVVPEKIDRITALRNQNPGWSVHELKLALGTEISFGEIRAVLETL